MTLGGLLKHLALVEDEYFTRQLTGAPTLSPPFDAVDFDADPDWEWRTAADDSPEELMALWESCVARSRAHVATAYAAAGRTSGRPSPGRTASRPACAGCGRPDRGVRAPHRPRRPDPRVDRRPRRRGHPPGVLRAVTDHVHPPWEPPFAGTETEHLLGSLDRLRATFRWKADGLDADGLHDARRRRPRLTLGGLLKHLAVQEDYAASVKIAGQPMPAAWDDNGWDGDNDWEFTSAADDTARRALRALRRGRASGRARSSELPRRARSRPAIGRLPRRTAARPASAGSSSTCSRSTAGTPATWTCSARPSTAGPARTRPSSGDREPGGPPSRLRPSAVGLADTGHGRM